MLTKLNFDLFYQGANQLDLNMNISWIWTVSIYWGSIFLSTQNIDKEKNPHIIVLVIEWPLSTMAMMYKSLHCERIKETRERKTIIEV